MKVKKDNRGNCSTCNTTSKCTDRCKNTGCNYYINDKKLRCNIKVVGNATVVDHPNENLTEIIVGEGTSIEDNVEFRVEEGCLEYRHEGDLNWNCIYELDELREEIEFKAEGNTIYYKYKSHEDWIEVIEIAVEKGDEGEKGEDGKTPRLRNQDGQIQWSIDEETWHPLINISTLKGDRGPKGEDGEKGDDGESAFDIWLSEGNEGSVEDFFFFLRGNKGDQGEKGLSIYEIWLAEGNVGTEEEFIESLRGPKGEEGEEGLKGDSVYQTWLEEGNTGSFEDFLATLKGEKGDTGSQGNSAYEVWIEDGNEGTETEFLEALRGPTGARGMSAYTIWLELGNTGSEEEFIDSLKGEKGDTPIINDDGNWEVSGIDTGVPATGEDGDSQYIHIRYADNSSGDGISANPENKKYLGIKISTTPIAPIGKEDYTWSKIEGPQGTKGESIDYIWNGTELGIKTDSEANFTYSDLKGDTGEDGLSAYEIWIEEGNTGTEQDYLDSLKGADGERGEDGDTPSINPDGNWEIGGEDTGVPAEGQAGEPGLTCRKYELDIEEDSEIKYTPCDNCDNQEITETFLKPIPCGEQGNFQSGGAGYPIIQPLNLGTSTGEVLVEVDGKNVPDRFILYREGVHVLDSGYRGRSSYGIGGTSRENFRNSLNGKVDPITGNTYPLDVGIPGIENDGYPEVKDNGVLMYNKTGAGSDYEMRVYAPAQGTAWSFTVGCPEGSTAAKSTLTLYSTTEPEFITGSGSVKCIGLASGRVGEVGPPGESPYQIWLSLGNTGTRQEYIDSLKGEQGDSAYEVWRQQPGNNNKTEADFLDWLRAASGDKYFEFVVGIETTAIDIPHNLSKYPSVSAFDTAGTRLEIRVVYTSKNDVTVMADESLKGVTVVFN